MGAKEIRMDKIELLKSHVAAYTRKDGTFVKEHDDKRVRLATVSGINQYHDSVDNMLGHYNRNGKTHEVRTRDDGTNELWHKGHNRKVGEFSEVPAKQDNDGLSGDVSLDHPAYTTPQKLRGYTGKNGITPHQATSARDAANVIIRNKPDWTKEDHQKLAAAHDKAADAHHKKWNEVANDAAQKTWNRPYKFGDYRVSGIASDEFPEEHKEKLRTHAHSAGKHEALAAAHRAAASSRLVS